MGLVSTAFKTLVATPVLAATMAIPAFANDAETPPVTNASVSATIAEPQFVDASTWSVNDARLAAAAASTDKVAIIAFGGTRQLQYEAFLAAQDLAAEGIPVAFIVAPDTNGDTGDALYYTYAKSAPYGDATYGTDNVHLVRKDLYDGAKEAHQVSYPIRVASNESLHLK